MTPDERAEFLQLRATGIGGSDASAVFNVGWGCARRLTYEKRGIEPDYPFEATDVMELGNVLEPFFADKYADKTGRTVSKAASFAHKIHPELRVNVDRLILNVPGKDGTGVLEIKSQGRGAYYKTKREGLSPDYILQLQWGMVVTGLRWGSFAIGCRDTGELSWWDVEVDQSLSVEILIAGPAVWELIKSDAPLPDRLEIDDHRCSDCPWRTTCQGNALMRGSDHSKDLEYAEDLRGLLVEYDEVSAKFQEKLPDGTKGTLDDLRLAEVREEIRTRLGQREAVAVAWDGKDRKVYFRPQDGRVTWKTEELVRRYEAMRVLLGKSELEFPPAENYKRIGLPYKTLRVY